MEVKVERKGETTMASTVIYTNRYCKMPSLHDGVVEEDLQFQYETPQRIMKVLEKLELEYADKPSQVQFKEGCRFARDEEITLFHTTEYLKRFDDACRKVRTDPKPFGLLELAVDVNVEWGTNKAVKGAAGCVLEAIDDVFANEQTRYLTFSSFFKQSHVIAIIRMLYI